jgi:hypothetical protein
LAKEYDLKIIEELNFHNFFEKYSEEYKELFKIYNFFNIDIELWFLNFNIRDAIYLYKVYVFEKIGNKNNEKSNDSLKKKGYQKISKILTIDDLNN